MVRCVRDDALAEVCVIAFGSTMGGAGDPVQLPKSAAAQTVSAKRAKLPMRHASRKLNG